MALEPRGNIDDILNSDEGAADGTGTDSGTDTGATDTDTGDDSGATGTTDATTGATTAASPAATATAATATADTETVAALRAEIDRIRNKNREYEAALLQHQKPAPAASTEEPPSFWDDPEAIINQRVSAVEQAMTTRIVNMSEVSAKARHADYDEKFQVFAGLVKQNPVVYQEMLKQPDPAEWAYRVAERQTVMASIGDPAEYEKQVEARIREKIAAEQAIEAKKKADDLIADKLPAGFSEARNVGTGTKSKTFDPNIPMTDILGGPKKK